MIKKCTNIIVGWLISCEALEESDKELYVYALYSVIISLAPLIFALGVGILMGHVGKSILIILPFMIIRKFSGGYHTKNSGTCFIFSCLLLFLCIKLSNAIICKEILLSVTVAASVSLIHFSPIENENRILSQKEHCSYRKVTILLVVLFQIIDIVLFMNNFSEYFVCISFGIILVAGLQLPCIFRKILKK